MNWTDIISDLIAAGMSQAEIAKLSNTGQSHVSCLLRRERKAPNWELGNALLKLHAKKCGRFLHSQRCNQIKKAA